MKSFYGLATGVGSLPHRLAAPALDVIFQYLPEIPHWPQLPASGEEEGLVRQYLSPLLERGLVRLEPGRSPFFVTEDEDWLERMTAFYTEVLEQRDAVDSFGFSGTQASGFRAFLKRLESGTGSSLFLKGQLTGPVTMGFQITDALLQPAFYRDELRDILVRSLAMQLRWQARSLGAFGLPVILFIDDPGLICYGQSTFVGLSRDGIQESLLLLIEAAREEGVQIGVHACAGIDWSLLFELPFDIINVDVYNYFTSLLVYTADLDRYLAEGGTLAFGLVPTSERIEKESPGSLLKRLEEYMLTLERRKVNAERLREQLLFTPSCGVGTLTKSQCEFVYGMLRQVSRQYRR